MGLTLDEFALWLNLEDVYWTEKGRQSIDAVIVTTCLLAITLIGLQFWIDVLEAGLGSLGIGGDELSGGESTAILVPLQVAGRLPGGAVFRQGQDAHRAGGPVRARWSRSSARSGGPSPARAGRGAGMPAR